MFENARYQDAQNSSIEVDFAGKTLCVPIDENNRHYKMLLANAVTIADYVNPAPGAYDINKERDGRISAGISFKNHRFDFDQMGKDNITGAATLAKFAMMAGAKAGDYRWHGGSDDFTWITQDNTKLTMDAHEVSELGNIAANWTTSNIYAARALKDMAPIPADYADDQYWP